MTRGISALFGLEKPDLLGRDETTRALPLVVGIVVFLMALSLSIAYTLNASLQSWQEELRGTVTIQILSDPPLGPGPMKKIVEEVESFPGVKDALLLKDEESSRLFQNILDVDILPEGLPLPTIIDVRLKPDANLDKELLRERLEDSSYDVVIDDNGLFLSHVHDFIRAIVTATWMTLILVVMVGVVVISLATRTGVALHRDTVEILHLIGSRDAYIARRFSWRTFYASLLGGLAGLAAALLVLLSVYLSFQALRESFSPNLSWAAWQWGSILGLPMIMALVSKVVALWTVLRTLGRMM